MFGNSSGGTGLFGSSQSKPAFGTAPNTTAPGFLFGGGNTTTGSGTNSNFSFGGSTNTANTANTASTAQGGLFGAKTAPASGSSNLFGQNASSGGMFGNTQNQAQQPQTGLFGSNTTSSAGDLFKSAPASNSGGLFGSSNPNAAPSSASGGLFGGSNTGFNTASSTVSNTASNTGLFGKPAPASGGMFGNTSQTQSGGLFGSKPAAPASGGLFGGSNTGGLFGLSQNQQQQNQQQQQQQNQNQQNQNQQSASLFGSGTANNAQPSFSWSGQQNNAPSNVLNLPTLANLAVNTQTAASSTYTPAINDQLIKLKEQWDPNSAKCALKTHLYNKFSEQEMNVLMQQPRPANESPEDWEKAMSNRPSAQYYPVKVTSFSEVAQRIEVQLDHVAKSRILLNNINEKQTQLSSKHDLDNTTRILKAKVRHTKLSRRLLRLATILAILKLKGYPLLPEEEEISKQFQALNAKISDPNGSVGKLSDLYARLAILKGRSEELSTQMESSIHAMNGGLSALTENTIAASEDKNHVDHIVGQLTKLLYKQQIGLSYLNEVLQKDMEVVDKTIKK